MLGLNETIDPLAMAHNGKLFSRVLKKEDGHVWRRALKIEVEG